MVNVFLVREGLILVRDPYAANGHESTVIPHLLDHMVPGAVVTLEVAGCQTAIVLALRDAGTDYVWPSSTTSLPSTRT